MEVDQSKENIQPLQGGRNAQQLGIALQAQTDRECQAEIVRRKQEFEELIRTYEGDDPLENHYNYICWLEQAFPKSDGLLVRALQHCLQKFEDDKRYTNDRRLCKLVIRYFDKVPHPIESYQMLKAKGLCMGCADIYKAWAYYYEVKGNYPGANAIYEEGKRQLAQPYEELERAHQNLILAAGRHSIYGPDMTRLKEERMALICLNPHPRTGRVESVRTLAAQPVTVAGAAVGPPNTNVAGPFRVFESTDVGGPGGAPPISVIAAIGRQDTAKENELRPGPWTIVPMKKRVVGDGNVTPSFAVHVDAPDSSPGGLRLPKNHPRSCQEILSDFRCSISYPEPPNPSCLPQYPKHKVYSRPDTEFSLEELRAEWYLGARAVLPLSPRSTVEMEILRDVECMQESLHELKNDIVQRSLNTPAKEVSHRSVQQDSSLLLARQERGNHLLTPGCTPKVNRTDGTSQNPFGKVEVRTSPETMNAFSSWGRSPTVQTDDFNIWDSPNESARSPANPKFQIFEQPSPGVQPKAACSPVAKFQIFEQSSAEVQPKAPAKGSAMKTAFKDLTAEELSETGSRGGMDAAAIAHPTESANVHRSPDQQDLSCNTIIFNLALDNMNVSTPQNKRPVTMGGRAEEAVSGQAKKQLFAQPEKNELSPTYRQTKEDKLSTILEETHPYASSTSSSKSSLYRNTATATTVDNDRITQQCPVNNVLADHDSYLQQNMSVNAELRSSLLANLMGESPPALCEPPAPMQPQRSFLEASSIRNVTRPNVVSPISTIPSDPFKASLINRLLDKVRFPGPHIDGYIQLSNIPKIVVKKELIFIGQERYVVEKQLGKGTFGVVFKAFDLTNNRSVAIKYQKPANKWEYYVCRELQARLAEHPLRDRFMDVSTAYFSEQASVQISEFIPGGSLLDLANLHKQKERKPMKECLVVYFCIQMLQMVKAMHDVKIIHADIKPDNFLVFILPDNTVGLQLIDFGCAIDMTLFPSGASFTRRVTTEDFVCCEMLDGRPWNYHTDLFCVAATAHVLLFDSYIKLRKQDGHWSITQRFNRWMKVDLWNMFFSSLLNQQSGPADTLTLIDMLEETLQILNKDSASALPSQMRNIVNMLNDQ